MAGFMGRNMDYTADNVGGGRGGQYVSFEAINALRQKTKSFNTQRTAQAKRGNVGRLQKSVNKVDTDDEPQREVAMRSFTITKDDVHKFYGRNHYLSSFYAAPMLIAGHMYPSVEHYYEACKIYALAGPYNAMHLKGASDPGQVKSISKQILASEGKSKKDVERWKRKDGLLVLRVGLMEKFRQNPELRSQLFRTGDALLAQCNRYDTFWATGMDSSAFDQWLSEHRGEVVQIPALIESYTLKSVPEMGNGKNLLGFILMYVRECLRSEYGLK